MTDSDSAIIPIQDSFDIIEARVQVRSLARSLGFDLFDQARISLAASTLATILGLGRDTVGQITVESYLGNSRLGIRVTCLRARPLRPEIPSGVLDDARRMVDEMIVESLSGGETKITLIKWPGRSFRQSGEVPDGTTQPRRTTL